MFGVLEVSPISLDDVLHYIEDDVRSIDNRPGGLWNVQSDQRELGSIFLKNLLLSLWGWNCILLRSHHTCVKTLCAFVERDDLLPETSGNAARRHRGRLKSQDTGFHSSKKDIAFRREVVNVNYFFSL